MAKAILISFIALALISVSYFAGYMSLRWNNMSHEYEVARLIDFIEHDFVAKGKWPRSPDELGIYVTTAQSALINYNLDLNLADRHEIMTSINNRRKIWLTYPHYEQNMERLYKAVLMYRNEKSAQQGDAPEPATNVNPVLPTPSSPAR